MSTKAEELAQAYADATAAWHVENLYGGSKSYTAEKQKEKATAGEVLFEEIRRLSSELAECKAAYESQFKELHALKASIGEPVAWLVLSTNPDGSTSIEYAAEWKDAAHDHISDAIMEYGNTEAGSWIVRPAYAIKDNQP